MLYPMKKLQKALNGDTDELIELTILFDSIVAMHRAPQDVDAKDSEFKDEAQSLNSKRIMAEIERVHSQKPTRHTRYLRAICHACLVEISTTEQIDDAIRELDKLSKEGYLLASYEKYLATTSIWQTMKTWSDKQEIPPKMFRSSNPLIRCKLIDLNYTDDKINVQEALNQYIELYNSLDNDKHYYLKRMILSRIDQLLTYGKYNPLDIAEQVREFYLDHFLFSEFVDFVHHADGKLKPETKAIFRKLINETSEGLLFTKKEIQAYFSNVRELHATVHDITSKWKDYGNGDFKLSDLQKDLYYASRLLDSKTYALDRRLEAIGKDCQHYSQTDIDFYKDHRDAVCYLNDIFHTCEVFVNDMTLYLRTIAGDDPDHSAQVEKVTRLEGQLSAMVGISNQFDALFLLEKHQRAQLGYKEKRVTVVNETTLEVLNNQITLLRSSLFHAYNFLLTSIINSSNLTDEIKSKLEKLIITADNLDAKFNQGEFTIFQKEWDDIIILATDKDNPLNKYYHGLREAHTLANDYANILGAIKKENDDIQTEKLCSDFRELLSRLDNTIRSRNYQLLLFSLNNNVISLQHQIQKLNTLNLVAWNEKDPPNFEKANKILAKIESIFKNDEKCYALFDKDNIYQNFKTALSQLEQHYKAKSEHTQPPLTLRGT